MEMVYKYSKSHAVDMELRPDGLNVGWSQRAWLVITKATKNNDLAQRENRNSLSRYKRVLIQCLSEIPTFDISLDWPESSYKSMTSIIVGCPESGETVIAAR